MTYSFEAFCADNRRAYDADGVADLESIRLNLERLIRENPNFVARECTPEDEYGYRALYTDPEKGFIVYSHKSYGGRTSPPHDHGASWAIYGQAWNATDMTEYRRLDDGSQDGHAKIERTRAYRLEPGQVGKFGPHDIHQIHFEDDAGFIRVTGADLFQIDTLTYEPESDSVTTIGAGSAAGGEQPPDAA